MTISVVIADDHRVVRDGLCYLLSQEPDVSIAGEAGDGRQALAVVAATRPDVLLLDLYMPGLDGHAVLAALCDSPHRATRRERLLRERAVPGTSPGTYRLRAAGPAATAFRTSSTRRTWLSSR
jgi:DNA-binding NarL/FixJ family response regulator